MYNVAEENSKEITPEIEKLLPIITDRYNKKTAIEKSAFVTFKGLMTNFGMMY